MGKLIRHYSMGRTRKELADYVLSSRTVVIIVTTTCVENTLMK